MTAKTKAALNTEVATNFADNSTGAITPALLRTTVNDIIDSFQQYAGVNAQTGTTYTVVVGDYGQLLTLSNASAVAVTLPQATTTFATFSFSVLNKGAGTVTITPTTSTINGAASLAIAQGFGAFIVSDGVNYQTLFAFTTQATPAGARGSSGLNIDQLTSHGDSSYAILATDRVVGTSATLSASRTWTLPAANTVNGGQSLLVADFASGVSSTFTLSVARSGSDTINGATSAIVLNAANAACLFVSDGTSKWTAQTIGAASTAGVSTLGGLGGAVGLGRGMTTSGGNAIANTAWTITTVTATNASQTVPAGTTEMVLEIWAGGGGGGGQTGGSQRGPGGGSGQYAWHYYSGTMDSTLNITIGAAGTATAGAAGGNGGNTTVVGANLGTLTVHGGAGALTGANAGGAGGATATGATITLDGYAGTAPPAPTTGVGIGGDAPRGGAGGRANIGAAGVAPGGGGAGENHGGGTAGTGARGQVIMYTR
jgi:hypothetical protein